MPVTLENPDILDIHSPALNSTDDMPKIEVKETPSVEPEAASDEDTTQEESAPSTEDTSANTEAKKPAKGVQKRIDELTRQAREAERLAQAEREEKNRILALLEKTQPKQETKVAEEPTREMFDDPDAYIEARIEWKTRQATEIAIKQEQERRVQSEITAQQTAAKEKWLKNREAEMLANPDYAEVAESENVKISIPMAHAIMSSDVGPKLALYLGRNPQESERISKLDPVSAVRAIGRIEAELTATKPKPISNAPDPIKPIGSKDSSSKSYDDMSMEEYAKARRGGT